MTYDPVEWDESTAITAARLDAMEQGIVAANEPGTVVMTARPTAPTGWLLCQGQAVSRATYADLFDAIGTTYGAGDGSTTFGLPDLRTRFPVGAGTGHALGSTGGAQSVAITAAQMPSHAHSGPSHTHGSGSLSTGSAGSHSHSIANREDVETRLRNLNSDANRVAHAPTTGANSSDNTNSAGAHSHNISGSTAASGTGTTGSAGSGQAHENRPPYVSLNFMIRT